MLLNRKSEGSMSHLFMFFVLLCCLEFGSCLKCWQCSSDLNWEKCKLLTSITCENPKTRCGSFYTKQGNLERYEKDCYTEDFCKKKPQCTSAFSKCEINCCSKSKCNKAAKTNMQFHVVTLCIASALLLTLVGR